MVIDEPYNIAVNIDMRSLPLTDKAGPGGRPRDSRAPSNAFAEWLATCGMTATEVAVKLTALVRRDDPKRRGIDARTGKPWELSISMVYNCRNAYAVPGRTLANAIAELSDGVVASTSWDLKNVRPRGAAPGPRRPKEASENSARKIWDADRKAKRKAKAAKPRAKRKPKVKPEPIANAA
ncbi:MAG TPA: hypothetical protein VLN57_21345 [Xanthobacteraceae bacterium]|nr:hypothetical protein [Xanthobacteraceae bacterium]